MNKTNRSYLVQKNISGSKVLLNVFADTVKDTVKDGGVVVDLSHYNSAFYQCIHILFRYRINT